jgi:hypothetical protein
MIVVIIAFACLIAACPYQAGGFMPYALLAGVVAAAVKLRRQEGA